MCIELRVNLTISVGPVSNRWWSQVYNRRQMNPLHDQPSDGMPNYILIHRSRRMDRNTQNILLNTQRRTKAQGRPALGF